MNLSPRVQALLDSMTLEQRIGQVFVFTFVSESQAHHDLRLHPGGFIRLFSDVFTVARQAAWLQGESEIPLCLAADFERGVSPMISGGTDFCSMMTLGAANDPDLAYRVGNAIAMEASALGINLNYVPVMDVNINEDNPIINTRAFGGDPELVSRLGSAFIRGHRAGGVLTCAKHFPGHGDTALDSHTSLSSIPVSRERLDRVELAPFRAAIAAGVDCIMSAHIQIPAVEPEPLPATLSRRILTGLLREEMGFEGVVTSDALEMGAISKNFSIEEATVLAFNAGCDMLIMPTDNAHSIAIMMDAVGRGKISEERLNEAVGRILTMKERGGILERPIPDLGKLGDRICTKDNQLLSKEAGMAGTTLVHNRDSLLPLKPKSRVAVISLSNFEDGRLYFLEPRCLGSLLAAIHDGQVQAVHCGKLTEEHPHEFGAAQRALDAARQADVVVVAAFIKVVVNRGTVNLDEPVIEFLNQLRNLGKPVVIVSLGSPYLIKQVPWAGAFVCAFAPSEGCQAAVAELLCGRAEFRGTMPVELHWQ